MAIENKYQIFYTTNTQDNVVLTHNELLINVSAAHSLYVGWGCPIRIDYPPNPTITEMTNCICTFRWMQWIHDQSVWQQSRQCKGASSVKRTTPLILDQGEASSIGLSTSAGQ